MLFKKASHKNVACRGFYICLKFIMIIHIGYIRIDPIQSLVQPRLMFIITGSLLWWRTIMKAKIRYQLWQFLRWISNFCKCHKLCCKLCCQMRCWNIDNWLFLCDFRFRLWVLMFSLDRIELLASINKQIYMDRSAWNFTRFWSLIFMSRLCMQRWSATLYEIVFLGEMAFFR